MRKRAKKGALTDLPLDFIGDSYIEIFGNHEAVLTGRGEITELEDSVLKIKCGEHGVCFLGDGLKVINYSLDGIRISGDIKSVVLE